MKERIRWIKLPVYDLLADCGHLEPARLGAHLKLALIAWTRAGVSIPNDPRWIKERLAVDDAAFQASIRPVLAEHWVVEGDELILPWLKAEAGDAAKRSQEARRNAEKRWSGEKPHLRSVE
jgi:uncharacterized protein YdaU (DUF1376 family)